ASAAWPRCRLAFSSSTPARASSPPWGWSPTAVGSSPPSRWATLWPRLARPPSLGPGRYDSKELSTDRTLLWRLLIDAGRRNHPWLQVGSPAHGVLRQSARGSRIDA